MSYGPCSKTSTHKHTTSPRELNAHLNKHVVSVVKVRCVGVVKVRCVIVGVVKVRCVIVGCGEGEVGVVKVWCVIVGEVGVVKVRCDQFLPLS